MHVWSRKWKKEKKHSLLNTHTHTHTHTDRHTHTPKISANVTSSFLPNVLPFRSPPVFTSIISLPTSLTDCTFFSHSPLAVTSAPAVLAAAETCRRIPECHGVTTETRLTFCSHNVTSRAGGLRGRQAFCHCQWRCSNIRLCCTVTLPATRLLTSLFPDTHT